MQTHLIPEQVVQAQLDAYNAHDLGCFLACFSTDISLRNFADGSLVFEGSDALRSMYENLFEQSPKLFSKLENRITMGSHVIDYERITGRMGNSEAIELVMINEVRDGKIWRMTVLR